MSAALDRAKKERKLKAREVKALESAFSHVESNVDRYNAMSLDDACTAIQTETKSLIVTSGFFAWLFQHIAAAVVAWIVRKALDHYLRNLRRSA